MTRYTAAITYLPPADDQPITQWRDRLGQVGARVWLCQTARRLLDTGKAQSIVTGRLYEGIGPERVLLAAMTEATVLGLLPYRVRLYCINANGAPHPEPFERELPTLEASRAWTERKADRLPEGLFAARAEVWRTDGAADELIDEFVL